MGKKSNCFRFTKASLDALEPTAKRQFFSDEKQPLLGLTVHPSGKKTYFARVTRDGTTRRAGIENGTYPAMTIETAREQAVALANANAQGVYAPAQRRAKRADRKLSSLTVTDAVEDFCERKQRRLSTGEKLPLKEGTQNSYRKTIKALLGEKLYEGPLCKLDEAAIRKAVEAANKSVGATGCRSLSSVWNWTAKQPEYRDKLPPNPVKEYARYNDGLHVSKARDRRLAADDFPAFFEQVEKLKPAQKEAVLWLCLTGNRLDEASSLEWSDINWRHNEYTLRDPKNRRAATLPIPSTLVQPLRLRRKEEGRVFPVTIRRHVEAAAEAIGVTLSPHDLRRTHAGLCSSVLSETSGKRLQNRVLTDVYHQYVGSSANLHDELAKVERLFYSLVGKPLENITHLEAVK